MTQTLSFRENFLISGSAAALAKTAAAPIERVKLLIQNQDEMLKTGRLRKAYAGALDCTLRTYRQVLCMTVAMGKLDDRPYNT